MLGSKNVLKKLYYDYLKIQEVNYLPPHFDGPCMFVLPPVHLKQRPSPWRAWTRSTTAMSGRRLRPPTLVMTLDSHFALQLASGTSNTKIVIAIIFNELIGPPSLMIPNSRLLPRIPSPSMASHLFLAL